MKEKNQLSLWRVFKSVILLIIVFITTTYDVPKEERFLAIEDIPYYEGNYNTINYVANMLDNIEKDNIIISPFNINSTLASLHNIDSSLKDYFHAEVEEVNNYYLSKMKKYQKYSNIKTEKEEYYEKLINHFYTKDYDKLNINSLNKMGTYAKKSLIKSINKILLAEESLTNKHLSIKEIKKYKIKNSDLEINNQTILSKIKNIIINYNLYTRKNYLINTSNLYYNNEDKILNLEYLHDKYLINIKQNNLSSLSDIKEINNNIYNKTNKQVNYLVDEQDLHSSSLITSSFVFNYKWEELIDSNKNTYEEFYINDEHIYTEMMNFVSNNYFENSKALGFIKDYENNKYSFIGILPKSSDNLSSININELINNKKDTSINISIPKFSYTDTTNLMDYYNKPINLSNSIKLDNLYQKVSFNFQEAGTYPLDSKILESTNIATLSSIDIISFDHPFYFMILDNDNNVVLIAGKITNPNL